MRSFMNVRFLSAEGETLAAGLGELSTARAGLNRPDPRPQGCGEARSVGGYSGTGAASSIPVSQTPFGGFLPSSRWLVREPMFSVMLSNSAGGTPPSEVCRRSLLNQAM